MRQHSIFSGLEVLAYNINRRQKDLKLFEFGKTGREMRALEASMEVDAQQSRLRRAEAFSQQQRQRALDLEEDFKTRLLKSNETQDFSWIKDAEEAIMTAKGIADQLDRRAKALKPAIEIQKQELSEIRNVNDALKVKEDLKKKEDELESRKKSGRVDKVNAESEVRALIAQQERQDEMIGKSELAYETLVENEIRILMERDQKISDIASDAYKKQEEERVRNQKASDREKLKQEKKSLKDIEAEQKRHAQQNAEYATQAVGIVTGATQQYVEARIKGEKDAEAMFVSSIMAQAGQALVGYGIQAIGRGVLEASNPVTAVLAPASFGTGAALIGAGVGLGGVAAGIGQLSAGGTIGKEMPDNKAAKDKGASPGRNSSGSGGGPLVVNVAYGVGGPLPEDTAREISKAVNTGRRRGGR
jgi:hypothetical protein